MFSNSFSFDGRIGRTEYGLSVIMHILCYCFLVLAISRSSELGILGLLYIPLLWFIWAQGAKRCHDLGNSGWMQIVPFYIFWMVFQEGTRYVNQYGADPKQIPTPAVVQFQNASAPNVQPVQDRVPVVRFPENQVTVLEVGNINYSLVQDVLKNLRRLELVKNQSYTFLENTARITINHHDTSQALLDSFHSIMEDIEVLGVGNGFINIKIK